MFKPVKWHGGNAAVPPSTFRRYIERNAARGLPMVWPGEAKECPLYIVMSGASLLQTWPELCELNGMIWATNSAYDWLCRKGLRPHAGVCLAAEDPILNNFRRMKPGDQMYFALQTHPDLVDRALDRGAKVTFWNPAHPEGWYQHYGLPDVPGPKIHGGGTVGTRAIDLAWVMGYRDVRVLGMDGCLSLDGRLSIDTFIHEDRRHLLKTWLIGGRAFVSLPSYARQVEDFADIIRPLTGLEVTLYGDGLLQWAMASSQKVNDAGNAPHSDARTEHDPDMGGDAAERSCLA